MSSTNRQKLYLDTDTLDVLYESFTELLAADGPDCDLILNERRVAIERRHLSQEPITLTQEQVLSWFGAIYIPLHDQDRTTLEPERLESAADDLYDAVDDETRDALAAIAATYDHVASHQDQTDDS